MLRTKTRAERLSDSDQAGMGRQMARATIWGSIVFGLLLIGSFVVSNTTAQPFPPPSANPVDFSWTFSFGTLLNIAGTFTSAIVFLLGMRFMFKGLIEKVMSLEIQTKAQTQNIHDIAITLAKMDDHGIRLNDLEKAVWKRT